MSLVIVTKRCFLICDEITHITLMDRTNDSEEPDERTWIARILKPRRALTPKPDREFSIEIQYKTQSLHGGYDHNQLSVWVTGYEEALELYRQVVHEIRDQKPDVKFLDQLVESMLNGNKLENTLDD